MSKQREELFNQLNISFNHIYILTIERATERQIAITNELHGLNFTFFYGFDKNNLQVDSLEQNNIYSSKNAVINNRYSKPMKLGEIACSMGHKAIYENMILNNYTSALILEDDVFVNTNNNFNFLDIVKQLPQNWDLIYFDYLKNEQSSFVGFLKQLVYHLQRKIGLLKWSHTTINNLFAKPYSKNLKIAGYHDFASAYAINNKTAQLLVKLQTPICYPADHVLPFIVTNKMVNAFITVPKIFNQFSQNNKENYGSYVEQ